jgi:hypothetical protein
MATKYRTEKTNNGFRVVEAATKFVLACKLTPEKAKAIAKHLNNGGAFNGATPPFFIKRSEQTL